MTLRFFRRKHLRAWASLDALAQRRAALLWRFTGADEYPTVDAVLGHESHKRWTVRDQDGVAIAEWWQIEDGGLLFTGTSDRPNGHAIQHGFVCEDRALWSALEFAERKPRSIIWALDSGSEPVRSLWDDARVADEALVEAVRARKAAAAITVASKSKSARKPKKSAGADGGVSDARPRSGPALIGEAKQRFEKGERAFVRYGADWYAARIEKVQRDGRYLISYDGWDSSWNEVVGLERLRGAPPMGDAATKFDEGQAVFISYGRYWYPGRIERIEGEGRYLISYDGWHSGWNEVVGVDRLARSAPLETPSSE